MYCQSNYEDYTNFAKCEQWSPHGTHLSHFISNELLFKISRKSSKLHTIVKCQGFNQSSSVKFGWHKLDLNGKSNGCFDSRLPIVCHSKRSEIRVFPWSTMKRKVWNMRDEKSNIILFTWHVAWICSYRITIYKY